MCVHVRAGREWILFIFFPKVSVRSVLIEHIQLHSRLLFFLSVGERRLPESLLSWEERETRKGAREGGKEGIMGEEDG